MRFDYTISHVPGKLLYTADTLFRAPAGTSDPDCKALQEDVEFYIECVTHHLPATERKLLEYQRHQAEDPRGIDSPQRIVVGDHILVPKACQKEILSRIHSGHLGIQRCKLRTQQSVWWPGVTKEIESMVAITKHWKQLKDEEIAEKEKQKLVKKKGKQTQNAKGKVKQRKGLDVEKGADVNWNCLICNSSFFDKEENERLLVASMHKL
ncbi:hypothetical protein EMCRGX_G030179 [Ephydatia muelleri]